ncbi:LysR family transcriptional regulator [Chitinasiproducens palmae]|uniref:DNA-binding transcriptional regulator, LysR family n=1 Tax=Chitinasiproducens palmae TaxID=1770053 RepID=A0A1H2PTK1_9BURK|nr:LysR family transcriptional regulator [Chitinasiproducens palmae]SDV50432.1 DNA-binding transcriptional regulator, LysR family [Chitinasiproducens palmae]
MRQELDDMLLFAEVARLRSVSRAGEALGTPKATVSRRLAAFEQSLGVRLFDRSTRRIELTEAGQAYFERCQPLLEEVEAVRDFGAELSAEPRGRLRVTAPADFAEHYLAVPIARYCADFPDVTVELDLSARRVDLIAERVDVAVRAGMLTDSNLVARRFGEIRRSLYASPAYLAEAGLPTSPSGLHAHRFVLLRGARRLMNTETLTQRRRQVTLDLERQAVQVNSVVMQRALAIEGAGIAVLPDALCESNVRAGQLQRVLADWSLRTETVHLVMPSRRFTPRKTRAFVDYLLAHGM